MLVYWSGAQYKIIRSDSSGTHEFIQTFNNYWLNIYYVPGTWKKVKMQNSPLSTDLLLPTVTYLERDALGEMRHDKRAILRVIF